MKKGFSTIMSAQFFSSLADNALFVAAVELLRAGGGPEWQRAALVPMFALFYVVLAPFVGAFADALPKGRVMFISNSIKIVGCLMMLFGTHPLLAYAVVGLGAAAYSPAKYGLLTELLPPARLVAANAWLEGLTIASVILGTVVGGVFVSPEFARALGLGEAGSGAALQGAVACAFALYVAAAAVNLMIPDSGRRYIGHPRRAVDLFQACGRALAVLLADHRGRVSLLPADRTAALAVDLLVLTVIETDAAAAERCSADGLAQAAAHGIRSIPTMILFKDGREIARQSGAMPAGQIVQWVRDAARG
jgi:MFS family permease